MHKIIERPNSTSKLHIIGNGHIRDMLEIWELKQYDLEIPDWIDANEYDYGYQFFLFKGELYCTADFTRIDKNAPEYLQEYDGILNDSFFSGILVKWEEQDCGDYGLKVYWFYC